MAAQGAEVKVHDTGGNLEVGWLAGCGLSVVRNFASKAAVWAKDRTRCENAVKAVEATADKSYSAVCAVITDVPANKLLWDVLRERNWRLVSRYLNVQHMKKSPEWYKKTDCHYVGVWIKHFVPEEMPAGAAEAAKKEDK